MKKNLVQNVLVHVSDKTDFHALADKVSEFHVTIIERRLAQSNLTAEQKIAVLDTIIANFKSKSTDKSIK